MSDPYDRYDDDREPLALRQRRAPPRKVSRPAPVALVVSLIVLVVAVGGFAFLYRHGVKGASGAPPLLGAPMGNLKAAAPPQPAADDPAAGLSIYKDDPAAEAPPVFAPPPETPAPRNIAPPPPPSDAEASRPVAAAPASRPRSIDSLIQESEAAPSNPAPAGGFTVQIGAFSSEALADRSWSAAAGIAPGPMAGKNRRVTPLEKDGVTLYRASITGFATRAEAQGLCDRLRAAGRSCFVK
jgi:cell division septation protein DedD